MIEAYEVNELSGESGPLAMTSEVNRAELVSKLAPFGVSEGYSNASGKWVATPTATLELVSTNFEATQPAGFGEPLVCSPDRWHPDLFGTLILESGTHFQAQGQVSECGYHILYSENGPRRFVICAPEHLPIPNRGWGWQVQLYAARTRDSWGIGDFRDLALICRIARGQGASCVQVSPVHAVAPIDNPQDSPYSPASRSFLNLLHVAPGIAPGAERVDLTDLSSAGRALNEERLIDRGTVWKLKRTALERIWAEIRTELPLEYRRYRGRRGRSLREFAIWSVITETEGVSDWRRWPVDYQDPLSPTVREFALAHADRVEFYMWCQWVAEIQYQEACTSGVDVLADLAVGFDSGSEDAWVFQDLLNFDFEIGAPPDFHNTEGQRWGLPPLNPQQLTRVDFAPFIKMVSAALRHASALRIDHVMQLWRLYWVPVDGSARDGVYVYYPVDALLAILRLEAKRGNAWIVGEDMGTVAQGVRETMESIGMLGNRSAMRTPVSEFPYLGVGTSSTHDQVTVAGLLTGYDIDELNRIGKDADFGQIARTRRGLAELAHIDPDKPLASVTIEDVHDAVIERYRMLSGVESIMVVVSLDDAAMVKERPNMPGTVGIYPNWRLSLPRPADDILDSPMSRDLAALMNESRRRPLPDRLN